MESTAFDEDVRLTHFLTDYLDEKMGKGERNAFEEYLENNPVERKFADKAQKGMQKLQWLGKKLKENNKTAGFIAEEMTDLKNHR
ncbi:MAG: hypothetical protein R3281_07265 [Balneolaceae bacterium]|nr:hypothetical protein [Balneolaceae bacterium]